MNFGAKVEKSDLPKSEQSGIESLVSGARRTNTGALFPLAALFIVAVTAVLTFLGIAASNIDKVARESSSHLIGSVFSDMEERHGLLVSDHSWWLEIVEQVEKGFDPQWADENIGSNLIEQFDLAHSLVFGTDNRIAFQYGFSENPGPSASALITAARPMIALARNAEPDRPEPAVAYVSMGDEVYLAGVSAILPEDEDMAAAKPKPYPVLIITRLIDRAVLLEISEKFLLHDLRFNETGMDPALELKGIDGRAAAAVTWHPDRPGARYFTSLSLPLGLVFAVMAGAAWLILARDRRNRLALEDRTREIMATNLALSQSEARAREAEAIATEASHAKSLFLANMSHELRTPLNAVIGFSKMIESEVLGTVGNPKYREYGHDIHNSASHLLELVRRILDMAKIDVGEFILFEEALKFDELLDDCCRMVGPSADEGGITLRWELERDRTLVLVDRVRLRQVVLNLLTNAIKFTPKGGRVGLVSGVEPDGTTWFRVTDTGIGMEATDIPRVLEPFGRTEHGSRVDREGAGLGLSLSKAIAELHGGTLEIESTPGMGTAVTVTLPINRHLR